MKQFDTPAGLMHAVEFEAGAIWQIFAGEYEAIPWDKLGVDAVIIDVGANVGGFARMAQKKLDVPFTVHCFEPDPAAVEYLALNARFANIHPIGLSNFDGEAALNLRPNGSIASSLLTYPDVCGRKLVPIRDAGSVFGEIGIDRVDLLKIDTEGCEVEILRSLGGRLRSVRFVAVEHHGDMERRLVDMLLCDFTLIGSFTHFPGLGVAVYEKRQ